MGGVELEAVPARLRRLCSSLKISTAMSRPKLTSLRPTPSYISLILLLMKSHFLRIQSSTCGTPAQLRGRAVFDITWTVVLSKFRNTSVSTTAHYGHWLRRPQMD